MASLLPRLDFGKWNFGDVAFGLRSGLLLNRVWVSTINSNNLAYRNPPKNFNEEMALYLPFYLILTKINKLKICVPFIQNHSTAIYLGILSIAALNVSAVWRQVSHKNLSNVRTKLDKFLVVAWRMTPYLAIATNIVLLILEAKVRPMKASAALVMTGISLLDLTPWMPRSFGWYLNVGIRMPIDFAALYYASNKNRFLIITGWVYIPEVQRYLQQRLQALAQGSQR